MNRPLVGTVLVPVLAALLFPLGQTGLARDSNEKAKDEIRQLFSELRTAGSKHDRAALERIFADEYLWIHANGTIENKARRIEDILTIPPAKDSGVDLSSERISIYGDVAIVRSSAALYNTTVFARKNGRWQFVQGQGTLLPPERKAVAIDPKTLDSFVGRYEFGPGRIGIATNESGTLRWEGRGAKLHLVPVGDAVFAAEDANMQITFVKDERGQVTGLVHRAGTCEESKATKLR